MLDRRALIRGLLAAPAIVVYGNIMPVRALEWLAWPKLWGDGIHDDTIALQHLLDSGTCKSLIGKYLISGEIHISKPASFEDVTLIGSPESGMSTTRLIDFRYISSNDREIGFRIEP